jgi:hypothetical protein
MASLPRDQIIQGTGHLDGDSIPPCQVRFMAFFMNRYVGPLRLRGLISISNHEPFRDQCVQRFNQGNPLRLLLDRPIVDGRNAITFIPVRKIERLSKNGEQVYEVLEHDPTSQNTDHRFFSR